MTYKHNIVQEPRENLCTKYIFKYIFMYNIIKVIDKCNKQTR